MANIDTRVEFRVRHVAKVPGIPVVSVVLHGVKVGSAACGREVPDLHADTNRAISLDARLAAPAVKATGILRALEMPPRNKILVAGRVQDASRRQDEYCGCPNHALVEHETQDHQVLTRATRNIAVELASAFGADTML
jgi:hypothetical protein